MGLRGGCVMTYYAHIGINLLVSAFSYQAEACSVVVEGTGPKATGALPGVSLRVDSL